MTPIKKTSTTTISLCSILIIFSINLFLNIDYSWSNLDTIKSEYLASDNLLTIAGNDQRSSSQVQEASLNHLNYFIKSDVHQHNKNAGNTGDAMYLSPEDAKIIIQEAQSHPVVSSWSSRKNYDPKNLGIGYCFGRALFINLELAYRNFNRDFIKKAFVVGPMSTSGGQNIEWGWHVTTIAQSKDLKGNEIWIALDPLFGSMDVKEWYFKLLREYSTDKKLKLYISDAGKFGPTPSVYEEGALKDPFYSSYFIDMLSWFETESKNNRYSKSTDLKNYNPIKKTFSSN